MLIEVCMYHMIVFIYIYTPRKKRTAGRNWNLLGPVPHFFFTSTNLQFFPALTQVGDFKATKIFRTLRHSRAVVGDFATEKSGENMEVSAAAVVETGWRVSC